MPWTSQAFTLQVITVTKNRQMFLYPLCNFIWCSYASVWYTSKMAQWNHWWPYSVSFSLCPFYGRRWGKVERMGKNFLMFKKWLYSSWLIRRHNHWHSWMPKSFIKSESTSNSHLQSFPQSAPQWHHSPLSILENMDMHKDQAQQPLGVGGTCSFAPYNLTRIYKHLQMDVSILFHLWICANVLIRTVNAKFKISHPDNNS